MNVKILGCDLLHLCAQNEETYYSNSLYHIFFLSSESAKFAEDPSFKMTMSRIVDMTYRFYAGLLTLSINRLRELSDTKYWATVVKPVNHKPVVSFHSLDQLVTKYPITKYQMSAEIFWLSSQF